MDVRVGGVLQKLLVDVIPQVLEDLLGVLLIVDNCIVILVYLFNTILSLLPELLLLVHDINFVFFLPLFHFLDFALEPLEVLSDVSVDRL